MHRQPIHLSVIQQRNELLDSVLRLFKAMGFPLPSINREWTLDELQTVLSVEHPELSEPLLFLALSATTVHVMRQIEAGHN
jgi:hypothetical protein